MWAGSARYQQRVRPGHRRPRRLPADQRVEGHVGGDRVLVGVGDHAHRRPATDRPGLPHRWRRVRGADARLPMSTPSYLTLRRVLATALEGRLGIHRDSGRRAPSDLVVHRRRRRLPGHRDRPGDALPRSRCRPALRQATRPDVHHRVRPRAAHQRPRADASDEIAASVAQVASTGALTAVFQPIFDLRNGAARASRASSDRWPAPASPTRASCSRRPRRSGGRWSWTSPAWRPRSPGSPGSGWPAA